MPHRSRFFRNIRSRLKSTVSALNGSPSWKRDAAAQRELPGEVVDRLPGQRQARHWLALAVDVHQALEHLADVVGADRAHAEPRVHVGRVVGEGDDQLGVGVDRHPVDAGGRGPPGSEGQQAGGQREADNGAEQGSHGALSYAVRKDRSPGRMAMAYSKGSKSAAVRARLDHPVIDGDGHWLEPIPIFLDYLREPAGAAGVEKFVKKAKDTTWYDIAPERADATGASPADVVGRAGRHARPRHRHDPAPVLRAARRLRHRLLRCSTPRSGSSTSSNPDEEIRRARVPRGQPDERRDVRAVQGPHHAGGGRAHAHARGGHRGGDLRRPRARASRW